MPPLTTTSGLVGTGAISQSNPTPDIETQANEIFARIIQRDPNKGIAASSFGKYDEFREWLASRLGLKDWKYETYATGASTTAHNFGSRWSQSNQVSGRHVPLGIGFIRVREDTSNTLYQALQNIVQSVKDTSLKFVNGTRPTSYDTIIIFAQINNNDTITTQGILAITPVPLLET
jgi:hypothetical protein